MTRTILFLTVILLLGCGQLSKKESDNNKDTKFEKIIFHTSMCYGTCPTYHLQVDNDKKIKLFAEKVYKNEKEFSFDIDSTKTGYFIGKVSDTTFAKLTNELETIGLDSLTFNGATCCDGSVITIISYYNRKRKFLKSMFPPEKANKLIGILYEICKRAIWNERMNNLT